MTELEYRRQLTALIQKSGLSGFGDISDIFDSVTSALGDAASWVGDALSSGASVVGSGISTLASSGATLLAPLAQAGATVASAVLAPKPQAATQLMAQRMAQNGYVFSSPQGQQFIQGVATQGVVGANGQYIIPPAVGYSKPSTLSTYLIPVAIAGVGIIAFILLQKRRR